MNRNTRKITTNKTEKKKPQIVTIGLIYANWCGHCQSLKPEWKKMKYNLMKTPTFKRGYYKFIEIEDSDKSKDLKINSINTHLTGEKLSANGYPTIFKIHGGKLHYYNGNRTAIELQNWFLNKNIQDNEAPPRGVYSLFNRMFGGKTKKNKSMKQWKK
uniref:Thioredoxin domain-containing protein n=1 Tax=viral metagenome TaxID=1070528 RepID=A0A6C0JRF9_9ZZZZ